MLPCLLLPARGLGQVSSMPAKAELVSVTVAGVGLDREQAIRDGLRKAVEQAGGLDVYAQSQTRDFVLVRDTVLARAAGYVQSRQILAETPAEKSPDGLWHVRLRCVVSAKGIAQTWGVVKNLLAAMGRPKVLVLIDERVDEVAATAQLGRSAEQTSTKQVLQGQSTVQSRIEHRLLASGFDLVDAKQLQQIKQRDLQAARADNDPATAQAIAKRFGAQLFIKGAVHAAAGLPETPYGVLLYTYQAQGSVKCYRSDTGQLISSQTGPIPAPRGAARVWRSAADQALSGLGDKLAGAVQQDILRFWLDALTGGAEVKLEVANISFTQAHRLGQALGRLAGVRAVTRVSYANRVVTYSIQATMTGEKLADRLLDATVGGKGLEITDQTANVIKARLVEAATRP